MPIETTRCLARVRLPFDSVSSILNTVLNPWAYHWAVVASNAAKLVVCSTPYGQPPAPDEFIAALYSAQIILFPLAAKYCRCSIAPSNPPGQPSTLALHRNKNFSFVSPERFIASALSEVVIFDPNPKSQGVITTTRAFPY